MTSPAPQRTPASFILGTAQLGMPYGVANRSGMPSEQKTAALLAAAIAAGLRVFDTGRAYGESEQRLGQALAGVPEVTIVTKLDPLRTLSPRADPDKARAAAEQSLAASRAALRRDRLDVVLLHRASHRTSWSGAVWSLLENEHARGRIGTIGVSVQSPGEALDALNDRAVRHLQLPFNLLDWRWAEAGVVAALRGRSDVCVHVRSAFLQGLLVSTASHWPVVPDVEPGRIQHELARLARDAGRDSRADLCIAFLRAQDWIDGIVVGCETIAQLEENLALVRRAPLDPQMADHLMAQVPRVPANLLDPSRWAT